MAVSGERAGGAPAAVNGEGVGRQTGAAVVLVDADGPGLVGGAAVDLFAVLGVVDHVLGALAGGKAHADQVQLLLDARVDVAHALGRADIALLVGLILGPLGVLIICVVEVAYALAKHGLGVGGVVARTAGGRGGDADQSRRQAEQKDEGQDPLHVFGAPFYSTAPAVFGYDIILSWRARKLNGEMRLNLLITYGPWRGEGTRRFPSKATKRNKTIDGAEKFC